MFRPPSRKGFAQGHVRIGLFFFFFWHYPPERENHRDICSFLPQRKRGNRKCCYSVRICTFVWKTVSMSAPGVCIAVSARIYHIWVEYSYLVRSPPGSAGSLKHSPSHVTNEISHDAQWINRRKEATWKVGTLEGYGWWLCSGTPLKKEPFLLFLSQGLTSRQWMGAIQQKNRFFCHTSVRS